MQSLCRDCLTADDAVVRRCAACGSPRLVSHLELGRLTIGHIDCDAFYASVEKRDRPELRDQPVIVGGGVRGVVTTACYIARLSGVRSAMPMFKARKLCPNAVILPPDFARYRAESRRIFDKVRALTPLVQPLALDEAWMDLSGTERLHGAPPAVILARLQTEIERDIGLPVSIGLGPNKFLAKIASDLDKPRGFAVIGAAEAKAFLADKSIRILPGVGPVQAASLQAAGYATVGTVADSDPAEVTRRLGDQGLRLWRMANGQDNRPVDPAQARKSISAETTFSEDLSNLTALEDRLLPLCDRVAQIARQANLGGRVITLKLRTADFRIITRRRAQPQPVRTAKRLFSVAHELLLAQGLPEAYRLIGVGLSDLEDVDHTGGDLFASPEAKVLVTETAMDALRLRFGRNALIRGRSLTTSGARKSAFAAPKHDET